MMEKIVKHMVKSARYVSFDLFDTLIKRNIDAPSDVFRIMEHRLGIKGFCRMRMAAEEQAAGRYKGCVFTLEDLYESIDLSVSQKHRAMQLEKRLETELCVFNKQLKELYTYCRRLKKEILITSDMYLDEETILNILSKNQIEFNRLYLSSAVKCCKTDKTLFRHILGDLNIKPFQMLHIGDGRKADFILPWSLGIPSVLVRKKKQGYQGPLQLNLWRNMVCNKNWREYGRYYEFGYRYFGILLYSFMEYFTEALSAIEYDHLSRDGYLFYVILKKVYRIENVKYVHVSRKSVLPALYQIVREQELTRLFPRNSRLSLEEIAAYLNIGEIGEEEGRFQPYFDMKAPESDPETLNSRASTLC